MKKVLYILFLSTILNIETVNAQKWKPAPQSIEKSDNDVTFTKVEVEAEFPGGASEWKKYLQQNLNANVPVDNKAPRGRYTVVVRFIVYRDGTISDVVPETMHGYGMEAEVVRVIKKGPNWTAAKQNGKVVRAYRRQPITFLVE